MPHTTKTGDTPTLRWTLGRDITGATPRVIIAKSGRNPETIVDRAATVEDATTGVVSITLTPVETSTPGSYAVEVETTSGGVVLTHPSDGYETLTIKAGLG